MRWDTGAVIPGTEGITPGPGVQLDHRQLEYAKLGGWNPGEAMDLTGANFEASDLTHALLFSSTLTNANLTGANLTNATLSESALTNANLTGANLTDAYLNSSTLTDANLTGANVTGTSLYDATSRGFTAAQLYSTQSYQAKNLSAIELWGNDLAGWDFREQNLTNADLDSSTFTSANLTGANVTGTNFSGTTFSGTTSLGFTAAQLYSTQSYHAKNLSGIRLSWNNLAGWNFREQNLTNADLQESTLTNGNLTGANLTNANLYSSALTNANLTGANLENANLVNAAGLTSAQFSPESVYSQWTQFPDEFSPVALGLTYRPSLPGDFDANDSLDIADIEMLQQKISGNSAQWWLPNAMFDLNNDSSITRDDVTVWVKDLKYTYFGDANLDGEFDSDDFVQVFQAGKYERGWVDEYGNSEGETAFWSEGDWNTDGVFDSGDFVTAFVDGGYEQGPRTDVATVPEPRAAVLILAGACLFLLRVRANWRRLPLLLTLLLMPFCNVHAQIYRWDNGQLIPGTEGITPGPGVELDHRELEYASFGSSPGIDLTGANFESSNLTRSQLYYSTLTDANLTGANLTNAILTDATLTNANLTGAVVTWADLSCTTSHGFTAAQLYSTQSYQGKDLSGIQFWNDDLTGWDFSGQNLYWAGLSDSILTESDLTGANLTNAYLDRSTLTQADLSGAVVTGASFSGAIGFTSEQLYSTFNYKTKDLREVRLGGSPKFPFGLDISGWDLSGQDLTGAWFGGSDLTDTRFAGAVVTSARFPFTTGIFDKGLSKEQLYSTVSYERRNLRGIWLNFNDLTGWDMSGQDLTEAALNSSTLIDVNLSNSTLTNANLTGTNLKNSYLRNVTGLSSSTVDAATSYNQWTVFPLGFDPVLQGLTLVTSPTGDLDADDALDADDVDMLADKISIRGVRPWWLPDAAFDMNGDSIVSVADHWAWVKDLKRTWFGDGDLNGEFNSNDFVQVFQEGKYETAESASWSEGDWNGDGLFDSADFITAFQDGGYEQGPRTDVAAVPEPTGAALLLLGLAGLMRRRRTAQDLA